MQHTEPPNNIPLPLSWQFTAEQDFTEAPLTQNTIWLPFGDVPEGFNYIRQIKNDYITNGKKVLIRGCNRKIKEMLTAEGFGSLKVGEEAVLRFDTEHFAKSSLKELVRRGGRHGTVRELPYSLANAKLLTKFIKRTRHGSEPQLCYLFHREFIPRMRLFVLANDKDEWHGALLLSRNGMSKLHTELLLKRKKARVGVMEALIHGTYQLLKREEWREWSLGEVPFVSDVKGYPLLSKTSVVNRVGRALRFAYNYYGLRQFKDKFAPHWQSIYLCAYPRVTYPMLYKMYTKANLSALIWHRLLNREAECVRVNTAIK